MQIVRVIDVCKLEMIEGELVPFNELYSIIIRYKHWKLIKPFITPYYEENDEIWYHLGYVITPELSRKINEIGLEIPFDFENFSYSLSTYSTEGFILEQSD